MDYLGVTGYDTSKTAFVLLTIHQNHIISIMDTVHVILYNRIYINLYMYTLKIAQQSDSFTGHGIAAAMSASLHFCKRPNCLFRWHLHSSYSSIAVVVTRFHVSSGRRCAKIPSTVAVMLTTYTKIDDRLGIRGALLYH